MPSGIRLPPQIRQPDRDGFDDTYEETRTRVDMEIGAPRIRNKMRAAPRVFNLRWTMTNDVYQVFDIWWQETIKGGEAEFDMQMLDDTDTLVWFTVRWQKGTYRAEQQDTDKWIVSGAVRSVGESFPYRAPGTDELAGLSTFNTKAQAAMLVGKVLFGASSVGIGEAKAKFNIVPFYGRGTIGLSGRGRLRPRPFYGSAVFNLVAQGEFARFGDDELILQFDAVAYTPDGGGAVDLQFTSDVYYPPHVA